MSCYVMLCHVMLFYVMLCYAMLCKLYCNRAIVPMYTMHHNTILNNNNTNHTPYKQQNTYNATIQCRNVQYNITQY